MNRNDYLLVGVLFTNRGQNVTETDSQISQTTTIVVLAFETANNASVCVLFVQLKMGVFRKESGSLNC